jgi:two-component system chemotaxis sensor kinase CheA
MNPTDLLDQFVLEARECLEAIGARVLDVERDPGNVDLLNDLFRSVHTLKGNCGLFEFKPLERVVHAGEDVLDHVRHGTLAYSGVLADALLDAMDYAGQLIGQIESAGTIEPGADAQSLAHATRLRSLLEPLADAGDATTAMRHAATEPAVSATTGEADWRARIDESIFATNPGAIATRYQPQEDCFFKGEDPWRLVRTTPGLCAIDIRPRTPWPDRESLNLWDCYRCNLDIVLISTGSRAELEAHFRCVSDQVVHAGPPVAIAAVFAGAAQTRLHGRALQLWDNQMQLLSRAVVSPGTVAAARTALAGLLAGDADLALPGGVALDTLPTPVSPAALRRWAGEQVAPAPAAIDAVRAPGGSRPGEAGLEPADLPGLEPLRRADEATSVGSHKILKVGQEKVDRLMELIGEMVVAKNSLPYLAQRAETVFAQRELAREIKAQYTVINRIAEDMQHAIMQVRMLPVGAVFQRFGRLVRDISRKLGKEVELVVEGEETEADKNVIESLADPLIHILRNSLDHGIELPSVRRAAGKNPVGTIRIAARQESDRVIIEISDDGAGVDPVRVRAKAIERGLVPVERGETLSDEEAVQLLFMPGFSTADTISDLSGRGVGMDVVRSGVENINGSVELSSVHGQGTTIRLSLPLSMAVSNVMVVESAGRRFGVPMDLIVETVRVPESDVHVFKRARTTVLRGRIVALRALNDLLALDAEPLLNEERELAVLVVRMGGESVGLFVDRFLGASDIILKPLEGVLAGLSGFAGTALMGDGGVLMVLNPKELLQ